MVYCGKASQGCQNCRTRRIKCDKIRPECSQCIRVGKNCPGYRDQLALMFRDESTKVMQKAHAQWGHTADDAGSSRVPSSAISSSPPTGPWLQSPAPSTGPLSPLDTASRLAVDRNPVMGVMTPKIPSPVGPSLAEQGIQFYVDHYFVGHPDEPRSKRDLANVGWLHHPATQDVMAALGLAGLSNLTNSQAHKTMASEKYVGALQQVGKSMQNPGALPIQYTVRSVVLLALFEVVKGTHYSTYNAKPHIMGAAALLRSVLPSVRSPTGGFQGLLQICFSMFVPCYVNGIMMPQPVVDWIGFARQSIAPIERPASDLSQLIIRLVGIAAFLHQYVVSDGHPKTTSLIQEVITLNADLQRWRATIPDTWTYETREGKFPAPAVFRGQYHIYKDMWQARVWSHYRWGRLLTSSLVVGFRDRYPASSLPLIPAELAAQCSDTIREEADEILISVPTHWRHPLLTEEDRLTIESVGGAGAGAAGIPTLLHHLKVAACAQGVSYERWAWAAQLLRTVWSDMGMLHARSLWEAMRAHGDTMHLNQPDIPIKREPGL